MKIIFCFILGLGLACILKGCLKERYERVCSDLCIQGGHEYGMMIDNWNCECHGKAGKNNRILRP